MFYPINQFRNDFYRPSRLDKLLETLESLPMPELPTELGGTASTPPESKSSDFTTTSPNWLTWGITFLLTLGGLLLVVPSQWIGIGITLLLLILFLWKIFPRFLHWLSPETPRMVANIIVGITVGIVTTATTHYLWGTEPVSLTGVIMAIVGWWLWKEHSSG